VWLDKVQMWLKGTLVSSYLLHQLFGLRAGGLLFLCNPFQDDFWGTLTLIVGLHRINIIEVPAEDASSDSNIQYRLVLSGKFCPLRFCGR
jgi:hypothetical protein